MAPRIREVVPPVGSRVTLKFGGRDVVATVIEDRGPLERLLVALRPLRHVVGRQVAQLHLAERAALRVGRAEHMAADDALVALARDRVPRAALPAAAFQPCLRRLADGPLRPLDAL